MNHLESQIDINLPVNEVYKRFTQFHHFPEFMDNVKRVFSLDDNQWRFIVETPIGQDITLDVETTPDDRKHCLKFQTLNGDGNNTSLIQGIIQCKTVNDNTQLHCSFQYDFPGERLVESMSHLIQSVQVLVDEDLENFKEWAEDGQSSRSRQDSVQRLETANYDLGDELPEVGTSAEIDGDRRDLDTLISLDEEENPYLGVHDGGVYSEDDIDRRADRDEWAAGEQDVFNNSMDVNREDLANFTEDLDDELDASPASAPGMRDGYNEGMTAGEATANRQTHSSSSQKIPQR